MRYSPDGLFNEQPIRIQAGGLVTGRQEIRLPARTCDAIMGNPPYINSKEMRGDDKTFYFDKNNQAWSRYPWRRAADIYAYFWLHAEQFLKRDGCLVLLTQAGWLDVDYGIPLQHWMLDNFRVEAILETEAEPWFTDARVATAVTVLRREEDPARRAANPVRFIQFRSRLAEITGTGASEGERQQAFAALRDQLLAAASDVATDRYRIRIVTQSLLERAGTQTDGQYVGSKWGRYLRSTETLYTLQRNNPSRFVPLSALGRVQRGITTNRDEFFLVSDTSEPSLAEIVDARLFRESFGVVRSRVETREISIVRRKDGVQLALETRYLRPIIKTARDVKSFSTRGLDHELAVVIQDRPHDLSELARAYVRAGEREGWHSAPSFEAIQRAGGNWYSLRESDSAPILFIKTMQYSPMVLWNDSQLLANQRLYTVRPSSGVDPQVLCAVLNSTIFACERYAAVKALGREAAIDVEVFSANAFRTPDTRRLTAEDADLLRTLMRDLAQREVGDMVEEPLMRLGRRAALAYAERTPISREVWPNELRDPVRERIDAIVMRLVGIAPAQVETVREQMLNELVAHTRKLRLLELEAQENRHGTSSTHSTSPRQLADDIWNRLIASNQLPLRRVPSDFFPAIGEQSVVAYLPAGEIQIEGPNLFEAGDQFLIRNEGRTVFQGSEDQANYLHRLAALSVTGEVKVPIASASCSRAISEIDLYRQQFLTVFRESAGEITSNSDLQERILKEGWKRAVSPG